jgi:hypothetical protein
MTIAQLELSAEKSAFYKVLNEGFRLHCADDYRKFVSEWEDIYWRNDGNIDYPDDVSSIWEVGSFFPVQEFVLWLAIEYKWDTETPENDFDEEGITETE